MLRLWLLELKRLPWPNFRTREQGGDMHRPKVVAQPQDDVLLTQKEGQQEGKHSVWSSLQLQTALQSCGLTAADVGS